MCTFSVTMNNIQAGKSRLQLVQGSKKCKTYEDMQMNQNSRGRKLFEEMENKHSKTSFENYINFANRENTENGAQYPQNLVRKMS